MLEIREEYYYTKSHEWVHIKDNIAICGISNSAQLNFGELVFIELPKINDRVRAGESICIIESLKSISDVYAPVSGLIIEVNNTLLNSPSIVNYYCYDKGWLFRIKMDNKCDSKNLLTAKEYLTTIKNSD